MIFEISFLLFMIKLSAPKGIWYSLRRDNPTAHKIVISYQRECERLAKAEAALGFLYNCKSNGVYPSFVQWTNAKKLKPRERFKFFQHQLNQAIKEKRETIGKIKTSLETKHKSFKESLTWMKYQIFKFSVSRFVEKYKERINQRHTKKLDKLLVEKSIREGIHKKSKRTHNEPEQCYTVC